MYVIIGIGKFLRSVDSSIKVCLTDPKSGNLVQFYNDGMLCNKSDNINTSTSIAEGIGQKTISNQLINAFDYNYNYNNNIDPSNEFEFEVKTTDDVYFKPDLAIEVSDNEMLDILQLLQLKDGLMCGLSSGINVAGAIKIARKLNFNQNNTMVTILCDSAFRTASKQFNAGFLESKNLPIPHWIKNDQIYHHDHNIDNCDDNWNNIVCT